MYPRAVARRSSLLFFLILLLCAALLPLADLSVFVRSKAQGQSQRMGHPHRGKPEGLLPDLEDVKNESSTPREPLPALPSIIRSPKLPLQPWNGHRVEDPEPRGGTDQANGQSPPARALLRRAHAPRRMTPPPLPD